MIPRTRGYIPHLETSQGIYFLTFRLEDSLPLELLLRWKNELQLARRVQQCNPNSIHKLGLEYNRKIEEYLDTNAGCCWLKNPNVASLVAKALRHFDGQRYDLHTWTIMPNHVHVLLTAYMSSNLSVIIHSWKSFTANQANRLLSRTGRFWQSEYFDRAIRNERHFEFCIRYILNNPVKAGLCKEVFEWPWTGCSAEIQGIARRFF